MVDLELPEEQLNELHKEARLNSCERTPKKFWVVYLKGNGCAHWKIAKLVGVDEAAITDYVRKYRDGALPGLLADHYQKSEGPSWIPTRKG